MKYLSLVWAGLRRKPVRSILTLLSIVVAFILFGVLQSVTHAFGSGVALAGTDRLVVAPKYSIIDSIPVSYGARIAQVPGVQHLTHLSWFGGVYKEPQNFFPRWPVDPAEFFEVFPEIELPAEQKAEFQQRRTAAIVGAELAETYGFQLGDKVPLIPDIWPNKDNGAWEFDVVGIYAGDDSVLQNQMYMNFAFFDEYRVFGQGLVGQFMIKIDDPERAAAIGAQIDGMFANSSDETKTQTEKAYNQMFANQTGNIVLIMTGILSAVFFTLILLTANTMAQSVRERIPEVAILKTVGFSGPGVLALVLAESLAVALAGSLPGLGLAALAIAAMPASVPFLGGTSLPGLVALQGLLAAMALGLLAGLPPALRALRLSIVDALRVNA